MASPIVGESGFDLVSHRAGQDRCSRYVLALPLLVPGVFANHV
jgi:hypothetical protein